MRTARVSILTAGTLAAALSASLAAVSPAAADPLTDAPSLSDFHDQEPVWAPCTEGVLQGLECADIEVPLDYSRPDGERITVAISRATATDPDNRRGVLLTNPGGPGGHGRSLPLPYDPWTGTGMLGGGRLSEVYDIIGMDPRGAGGSSPRLDCGAALPPLYPRPTDAEVSEVTRSTIWYQRACERTQADLRPHMTTANTARDMDVVRAALGEESIDYLGYSYGTYLGAVYGSLFPERLDRSVLDSSVHPDGIWRGVFLMQAPAYSANMDRYTAWAAEHDDVYGFGSTQEEVYQTFEETSARLRENPRDDIAPGVVYDNHMFDFDIGYNSRFQHQWDIVSDVMGHIVRGEPMPQESTAGLMSVSEEDYGSSTEDLLTAVVCEAEWPKRIGLYHADMREYREEHPYGTGAYWASPQGCTFSTLDRTEDLVELERDGYPEGLVIAGEFDANTAYEGGPAMAERLDGSLITVAGDGGHGFYGPFGVKCVIDAVDAYLVDGAAPRDLTCQGLPPAEPTVGSESDVEELVLAHARIGPSGLGL